MSDSIIASQTFMQSGPKSPDPSFVCLISLHSAYNQKLDSRHVTSRPGRFCYMHSTCDMIIIGTYMAHRRAVLDKEPQGLSCTILSKIFRLECSKGNVSIVCCLIVDQHKVCEIHNNQALPLRMCLPAVHLTSLHVTKSLRPSPVCFDTEGLGRRLLATINSLLFTY